MVVALGWWNRPAERVIMPGFNMARTSRLSAGLLPEFAAKRS
jgi:hypothetical protein